MFETLLEVVLAFTRLFGEMAPYLLLGLAVAALLEALLPPRLVERHLGRGRVAGVVKAALLGVPLPLCSCGVIPVAASLRRSGAGRGATVSFLISTPQTGADSFFVTYGFLGLAYAIFRPVVALVTGILGGLATVALVPEKPGELPPGTSGGLSQVNLGGVRPAEETGSSRWRRGLRYGLVALPGDLGGTALVGIAAATLVAFLIPAEFLAEHVGSGSGSRMLVTLGMMLAGIPLYVCSTGSVPLAAVLIAKGVSPGAALAFLIAGPATNTATIAVVWKVLGRRTALVYLATIALGAFGAGVLLDGLLDATGWAVLPAAGAGALDAGAHGAHGAHGAPDALGAAAHLPLWLRASSGILLAGLIGHALLRRWLGRRAARRSPVPAEINAGAAAGGAGTVLTIAGMTCEHCRRTVTRAVSEVPGVTAVEVNLAGGWAFVSGTDLDSGALRAAVEAVGYRVVGPKKES